MMMFFHATLPPLGALMVFIVISIVQRTVVRDRTAAIGKLIDEASKPDQPGLPTVERGIAALPGLEPSSLSDVLTSDADKLALVGTTVTALATTIALIGAGGDWLILAICAYSVVLAAGISLRAGPKSLLAKIPWSAPFGFTWLATITCGLILVNLVVGFAVDAVHFASPPAVAG